MIWNKLLASQCFKPKLEAVAEEDGGVKVSAVPLLDAPVPRTVDRGRSFCSKIGPSPTCCRAMVGYGMAKTCWWLLVD